MGRQARVRAKTGRGSAMVRWWRQHRPSRRQSWWAAGVLVVLLAGVATWVFWPEPEPEPRARQYREATACLLTDDRGVTGPEAAAVWAGMQDASLRTRAKVQFLEVDGAQTIDNARTYLGSLVQGRCDLVLAVGEVPVGAVRENAARFPSARFVTVGSGASTANVSVVTEPTPEAVRAQVDRIVAEAVGTEGDR
ncbi:hypothetical protein ACWDV4_08490 [Micromonospora sp. NPDC003197]